MYSEKAFLLVCLVLTVISAANADLVLKVNGFDTSTPVEIAQNEEIIITLDSQICNQQEDYSIICETGGKLTPLSEPNSLAENIEKDGYLFSFEDEKSSLAIINLNNDITLDYQLVIFNMPDANTIVLGIDSGAIKATGTDIKLEPELENEQIEFPFPYDNNDIISISHTEEQEKKENLKYCPSAQSLIPSEYGFIKKESKSREFPLSYRYDSATMHSRTVIDINSDITSNQIWTADNTYHIIEDVNVQALLVIEPGTVIGFAAAKAMFVNNGGALISVGTPNEPVIYTSDSGTPSYGDYYCPMCIEQTASDNTKIIYSYIEYAYAGIITLNKELNSNIENNCFYSNVYGIIEHGIEHTDIQNNLIFGSYYSGIEIFMESAAGQADANSRIIIENNTCDYYQDNGITVHGVEDANKAGLVVLNNNIVSGSYQYGLALVDDYMSAIVANTGYFDNTNDKNWAFDEDNPIFETAVPYETGTGILPLCYLKQDCNFIDAGNKYIQQTSIIGCQVALKTSHSLRVQNQPLLED